VGVVVRVGDGTMIGGIAGLAQQTTQAQQSTLQQEVRKAS
jgi:type III secretory pathway component EscS